MEDNFTREVEVVEVEALVKKPNNFIDVVIQISTEIKTTKHVIATKTTQEIIREAEEI